MTQKSRATFKADNLAALPPDKRPPISAENLSDQFGDLADSAAFEEDLSAAAYTGELAHLDTGVTGIQLDAIATKVAGIEAGATDDQTGAEIVTAINVELGSSDWQGSGGGGGGLNNVVDDLTPDLGGNLGLGGFAVGPVTAVQMTKLSQITATAVEVNYSTGVTSPIQAQFTAMNTAKANASHVHAAADVTSGAFALARISEASVTQHQGALVISASQIPDLPGVTPVDVTFEALDANGDVGTSADQVAEGNHTHTGVYEPYLAVAVESGASVNLSNSTHNRKLIILTHAAPTLVIRPNATHALDAGFICAVASVNNAIFDFGTGVTANGVSGDDLTLAAMPGGGQIVRSASDTFYVIGAVV